MVPRITRRNALRLFGGAVSVAATSSFAQQVTSGRFTATSASLRAYTIPDWFSDAKFGIWAHWGPQSAIGEGDWYARNMYREGSPQYEYHRKRFGPQSKVGYKDLIPLFTADKWDPEHLMDLYQKAGAKYFFSLGVHHDNFDLWNSKYQPRWNAVASGPRRDIVGEWAAAARRRGMRFGVSEHLSNSFEWFAPAHLADTKGPYAGVPYDGQSSAFGDLYHDYAQMGPGFAQGIADDAMGRGRAPEAWKRHYFKRVQDLIDQHQPDLLYTDGAIPFDGYGLGTVAELYNTGPLTAGGGPGTVYFSKTPSDCIDGRTCVLDHERGVLGGIAAVPWQSDTCIGQFHYQVGQKYTSAKKVIDMLVDVVAKNGNLLLNFPLPASGELDAESAKILTDLTAWMQVNGEGIFASRPWTTYGEGPSTRGAVASDVKVVDPRNDSRPDLGATDIRFTAKGETIYAFVMGWPQGELRIESLAPGGPRGVKKAVDVRLVGQDHALRFSQDGAGLRVALPANRPPAAEIGITVKVRFA